MYPSRLAQCRVPVGKATSQWGKDARTSYAMGQPGIYRANVTVPKMFICPLPVRTKDRVIYPYGRFTGTWALPELRLASELGCEVEVRQSLVWENERVVFKDWIDKLFHIRATARGGKKGPLGTFIKYYLNSLTGKFGSKPLVERIIINPQDGPRPCTCKTDCQGACGCYTQLDDAGLIVSQKSWRLDACSHVEWASYLTSEARCEWLRQALSLGDGGKSCVYGDTDSLFIERELTRNLGSELGEWECKGEYNNGRFVALKVYSFERDNKLTLQAKGVSVPRLKNAPFEAKQASLRESKKQIEAGNAMSSDVIKGVRSGAKDGFFFNRSVNKRAVTSGCGDRILDAASGLTYPQEYNSSEDDNETDDC
jgi:hypothetical protein